MSKQTFSATVFFQPNTFKPRKYRNISSRNRFEFNMTKTGAYYINYYNQTTKAFLYRKWLQNFKSE